MIVYPTERVSNPVNVIGGKEGFFLSNGRMIKLKVSGNAIEMRKAVFVWNLLFAVVLGNNFNFDSQHTFC